MLSKLVFGGLGIAAAIIFAPTAAADLTNLEVAGGQREASAPAANTGVEVLPVGYSGPSSGYWLPVLDPQGRPYTDATGRVEQRCVTNSCDKMGETRIAPMACGYTAPVNERPKPPGTENDSETAQPTSNATPE